MNDTAERRMFAKTIVLSDAFLDMPMSSRCLYFTLGMLSDDEGFVNAPRAIMRQCGASDDDMNLLISKKFVLLFDSGVIVIKHWRINNYLQKDRIKPTKYIEEKAMLSTDEKGGYTRADALYTGTVYTDTVYTQDSVVEDRLEENSLDKDNKTNNSFFLSDNALGEVMGYYMDNFDTDPGHIEYIKAMVQSKGADKILESLKSCENKKFTAAMKAVKEA